MMKNIIHPFLFPEFCVYWKVAKQITENINENKIEFTQKGLAMLSHPANQLYFFLRFEQDKDLGTTVVKVFLDGKHITTTTYGKGEKSYIMCILPKELFSAPRHYVLKLEMCNIRAMHLNLSICRVNTENEVSFYIGKNVYSRLFEYSEHYRKTYPQDKPFGNKLTLPAISALPTVPVMPTVPTMPALPTVPTPPAIQTLTPLQPIPVVLPNEYTTTKCNHKETFTLGAMLKVFSETVETTCPLCKQQYHPIDVYNVDMIGRMKFSQPLPSFTTKESPEKPVEKPSEPPKKKKRKITNINFFDVFDKYVECNATWAPAFKEFIEKNSYNNNTIRNFVQFAKVKNLCQKDMKKNPGHPPSVSSGTSVQPAVQPPVQPPVQPTAVQHTVETTPPRGQSQPVLCPPSLVIQHQQVQAQTTAKSDKPSDKEPETVIDQYVEEVPDETGETTELPEIRNIFDEEAKDSEEEQASKTAKTDKSPKRKRKHSHSDRHSDSYSSEYPSSDDSGRKHKRKRKRRHKERSDSESDSDRKSDSDKSSSEDSYEEYKRAKRKRHAKRKRKERHAKRIKREKQKKKQETDSESDHVDEGKDTTDDEEDSDDGSEAKDEKPKKLQSDFECRSALDLL